MSRKKPPTDVIAETPSSGKTKPRNHRELGQAVFTEVNPVTVACGLLNSESESVKVRALETVANWAFGSLTSGAAAPSGAVRVVCSLPRPVREGPAWAKLAESQSESEVDPREEP